MVLFLEELDVREEFDLLEEFDVLALSVLPPAGGSTDSIASPDSSDEPSEIGSSCFTIGDAHYHYVTKGPPLPPCNT